jgi:hypothetical protein
VREEVDRLLDSLAIAVVVRLTGLRLQLGLTSERIERGAQACARGPFSSEGIGGLGAPLCACTVVNGEEVFSSDVCCEQAWVHYLHPKLPHSWSARGSRRPARRESAFECDRQRHCLATYELGQHGGCVPEGFHRHGTQRQAWPGSRPEILHR